MVHSQRGSTQPQMQGRLSRPRGREQTCQQSSWAAKKGARLLWPAALCWAPSCSASGPALPRLCPWVRPATECGQVHVLRFRTRAAHAGQPAPEHDAC